MIIVKDYRRLTVSHLIYEFLTTHIVLSTCMFFLKHTLLSLTEFENILSIK